MRLLITVVASIALIAGCSSGSGGSGKTSTSASSSTPVTTSSAPTIAAAPSDPIAEQIAAGNYPACKLTVGEPQSVVVPSGGAASVDVRCYTGDSLSTDDTGAGVTNCNPTDTTSAKVYYWASKNPAATDQNVYAAKQGGNVVVVPDEHARDFFTIPGGLAGILLAVGSC